MIKDEQKREVLLKYLEIVIKPPNQMKCYDVKMKICVIAPSVIPVLGTNQRYGGIEHIVGLFCDELVKRGHEVYLIAPGDSKTKAKLIGIPEKALGQEAPFQKIKRANNKAYKKAISLSPEVIWDHTLALHMTDIKKIKKSFHYEPTISINKEEFLHTGDIPVIHTIHGPAKFHLPKLIAALSKRGHFFVFISNHQAKDFKKFTKSESILGIVYNSINLDFFKPNFGKRKGYLFWAGRFCMEKGAHVALHAAKVLHKPLFMMGKMTEKHEREYFDKFIKGYLDPQDKVFLNASALQKRNLFKNADLTLMTNLWAEPFGLVAVESMATGTAVVGPSLGALTEIINDSGILVNVSDLKISGEELEITKDQKKYIERTVEQIKKAKKKNPKSIRRNVEKHFSIKKSVDGYEKIFREAVRKKGVPR